MITKKCQEFSESYTFDEAIAQTGYGSFHHKAFAICALCILCVGFQNGLTSYVFSPAQCDLNFQSQDLGLLNVSFLIGGTLSAFLWGVVADMKGRKKVLIVTIILDSVITLACTLMPSFSSIMICRFLNGVLIGCPGSVTFTYLAEFHSPKYRAKSVCYSGVAFITGWVLLPILTFLILPLSFKLDFLNMPYTPWRVLLAIIAVPELLAGLCLLKLPESPKFLHDKNRSDEALKILTNIYCQNTNRKREEFIVKTLVTDMTIEKDTTLLECQGKSASLFYDVISQVKKLFSVEIRMKTLLLCLITLSNVFGYFGLGLWLPEFFIKFEEHYQSYPNESITLRELTFSKQLNTTTNCFVEFDINTFQNTLIVAASALVCNTLAGWLAGKVSVKSIALATMLFGGISSLSIYWIRSPLGILAASSVFQSSMATGNMVIGSIVVEQFPTSIGAMALCLTVCAGRIGAITSNILFSALLGKYNGVVILIVSGVLLLGAALCIPVPSHAKSDKSVSAQKDNSIRDSKVTVDIFLISRNSNCNATVQND